MATSARQDARSGVHTSLTTYRTANPTLLSHVYDHPPSSPRTPCAYVEKGISESIAWSGSVRQRVMTVRVVVLNRIVSHEQATDEQDVLLDGLLDRFTTDARTSVSNARVLPVAVEDTEVPVGDATYAGFVISLQAAIQEGRSGV